MESRPEKRQRSDNWLEEDKIILKELIKERVSLIENKNTDTNTNSKKVAAWHDLRIGFNNMAKTPRTLKQIKAQWGLIKMVAKKKKFLEKKERFQTGGGPPPTSEPASVEDIAVWLPHEFTIDTNKFDSDNQNFHEKNTQLENIEKKHEQVPLKINIEETQEQVPQLQSPLPCENSGHESTEMMLEPSTSQRTTTKLKKISKNKKVSRTLKDSAALQIAETEMACRKELHAVQMANEKQILKKLLLKEELLKAKLEYYKNKLH